MTCRSDLIGRQYPMTDGGYLELSDGPEGLWVWRVTPEDACAGDVHVRHLPPAWVVALTPDGLGAWLKDFGDRGIGWGVQGDDAATIRERLRREERELEWRP